MNKTITVYDLPKVKFETIPKEVYIPEQELRCLNYTQGAKTYLWKFGDGETSSDLNSYHTYKDSGFYNITLVAITENQCTDSLTVSNAVHVIEKSRIKFPSAFTPNPNGSSNGSYNRNDFSNNVFYPIVYMGGIENYHMEIFNRWGVLLFESNNIEIGWDGYYKGELLMQDIYIYRVSGIYNDSKRFSIIGVVLLMKK